MSLLASVIAGHWRCFIDLWGLHTEHWIFKPEIESSQSLCCSTVKSISINDLCKIVSPEGYFFLVALSGMIPDSLDSWWHWTCMPHKANLRNQCIPRLLELVVQSKLDSCIYLRLDWYMQSIASMWLKQIAKYFNIDLPTNKSRNCSNYLRSLKL